MKIVSTLLTLLLAVSLTACGSSPKKDAEADAASKANSAATSDANAQGANADGANADGQTLKGDAQGIAGVPSQTVIYFDYDSSQIHATDNSVIDSHAQYLMANPNNRVRLEGHADERGSPEYNLALGEKRAHAVRSSLNILGVKDDQMQTTSYGEESPADAGHNETSWSKNRRVQIIYSNGASQ